MTTKEKFTAKDVQALRQRTGAGMMESKKALEENDGDMEKAIEYLRTKGIAKAEKRVGKQTSEGMISSYIHHGARLGALIELNCETDFVARTDEFQRLARDLAMAVAGHDTVRYVSRDQVPPEVLEAQRSAFALDAQGEGKPADRVAEIVEGKLNKWLETACLLELRYRDTDRKIADLITEKIALLGENIRVARFARMAVGETGPGQAGLAPEAA